MASYGGASLNSEELLVVAAIAGVALWGSSSAIQGTAQVLAQPVGKSLNDITGVIPFLQNQIQGFENWVVHTL